MSFLRRLIGRGSAEVAGPDLTREGDIAEAAAAASSGPAEPDVTPGPLVSRPWQLVNQVISEAAGRNLADADFRALPAVRLVSEADETLRSGILLAIAEIWLRPGTVAAGVWNLHSVLVRRRLVLTVGDLDRLLEMIERGRTAEDRWRAANLVERTAQVIARTIPTVPPMARARAVERVAAIVADLDADIRWRVKPAAMQQLRDLLPGATEGLRLDSLTQEPDGVGPRLRAVLEGSSEDLALLTPFVEHLLAATKGGRPSATWMAKSREAAAPLRDARGLLRALLAEAVAAPDQPYRIDYGITAGRTTPYIYESERYVSAANEAIVRNVVWAAAAAQDPEAVSLLRSLAEKTVTVIGGQFGQPRSLTVAMACPAAIAQIGAPGSLTALQGLQRSIRHGSLLREIEKAMDGLARSRHVTRSELLETAVERHDLDDEGSRRFAVGDWTATVAVTGSGEVVTTWHDATGKERPSLPKAVKDAAPVAAKDVATAAKAIRDTVASERARLDRLLAEGRRWTAAEWRSRYLGHPITGALARRLIWRFGDVIGLPGVDGRVATDAHGTDHSVDNGSEVSLWHPVEATEDLVRAWRERLMETRLAQPIKQAFRELYVVTPAELQTVTYSNRFAGHVIRQVQARALMKGRGWAPVAVAWWDDGIDVGVARRTLEAHGVRVEFVYDPIMDIQPTTTDLWPYCTTDQVRFFRAGTDEALPVDRVPRVAFSELMRDVDLFVAVTTIGADPQWLDQGERRFDRYWHQWGFGDLGQAATIRHDVLARLLPALRIADRCTLGDRYLEVRGSLRTYRIHLGSGNILMSPSDRYLCIVAARHPSDDRLFLPFEDDPMLSLILSKAFLLADDQAITDPTIVRQLQAG